MSKEIGNLKVDKFDYVEVRIPFDGIKDWDAMYITSQIINGWSLKNIIKYGNEIKLELYKEVEDD